MLRFHAAITAERKPDDDDNGDDDDDDDDYSCDVQICVHFMNEEQV